jgi:IS30 family transposase
VGATIEQAAASVGVSKTGARGWVAESGGVIPDLAEPSGRYLSLVEREEIAEGWAAGLKAAENARRIGRHRSTIGRELERNRIVGHPRQPPLPNGQRRPPGPAPGTNRGRDRPQHERLRYRPSVAQAKAEQRARRPKPRKLAGNAELATRVQAGLTARWSPEQIRQTLRRELPDRPEMWVSHETIYQELYVQGRGELRRELTRCLRTGRALRRPRRLPDQRRERRIPGKVMISERPAEVEDRSVPGHWEGDLIIGKDGGSAIGTLVERSSRFVMLLHLPHGHRAEQVRDAMITTMHALPVSARAASVSRPALALLWPLLAETTSTMSRTPAAIARSAPRALRAIALYRAPGRSGSATRSSSAPAICGTRTGLTNEATSR